jgi:hypothetical protein
LTAGMNALAMMRFGGIRMIRGGEHDGFAWFLIGVAALGTAIWAVTREDQTAPAKN